MSCVAPWWVEKLAQNKLVNTGCLLQPVCSLAQALPVSNAGRAEQTTWVWVSAVAASCIHIAPALKSTQAFSRAMERCVVGWPLKESYLHTLACGDPETDQWNRISLFFFSRKKRSSIKDSWWKYAKWRCTHSGDRASTSTDARRRCTWSRATAWRALGSWKWFSMKRPSGSLAVRQAAWFQVYMRWQLGSWQRALHLQVEWCSLLEAQHNQRQRVVGNVGRCVGGEPVVEQHALADALVDLGDYGDTMV